MHDDDQLMAALRTRVLDDDVAVSSLLRTCLMLGKRLRAETLASWSRRELEGYPTDAPLPEYRRVGAPLFAKIYTPRGTKHQQITKFHIPNEIHEKVALPDELELRQPIDELERMASDGDASIMFTGAGMTLAASLWSHHRGEAPFAGIENIYFKQSPAQLAGLVGTVRSRLVELVGDLTADLPMNSLPTKEQVETAVSVQIYGDGDHNHVSVGGSAANLNVGTGAQQNVNSSVNEALADVVATIAGLRGQIGEIADEDLRGAASDALDDLEAEIVSDTPSPEAVRRRGRLFSSLLSSPAISAALSEAAKALVPAAIAAIGG